MHQAKLVLSGSDQEIQKEKFEKHFSVMLDIRRIFSKQ
jgi:hypothetical protein